MSKKQDAFYFDNFVACAEFSCQASKLLKEILTKFNPDTVEAQLDTMHEIEHNADQKKHELTDRLAKAFITPVEREDLADLSHYIDELTDKIEEVLIRIYINNVKSIRPEAISMLDIVIKCCEEVCVLLKEFADFRHSKKLKDAIININSLEEDADKLFISSMRGIHTENCDVFQVIAWREVYSYLEQCADACEHIADTVENVVMNNS